MDTITTFSDLADAIMEIWWEVADDEGAPLEEYEIIEMSWAIRDEDIVNVLATSENVEHLTVAAAIAGCRGISVAVQPLCHLWRNGITDDWLREYVRWALVVTDPQALNTEIQRLHLAAFWRALSEYVTTTIMGQGGFWQPQLL